MRRNHKQPDKPERQHQHGVTIKLDENSTESERVYRDDDPVIEEFKGVKKSNSSNSDSDSSCIVLNALPFDVRTPDVFESPRSLKTV